MSDNYPYYLAYRSLNYQIIPVTVMGNFPAVFGEPIKTGGAELIPPAWILQEPNYSSLTPELQDWLLEMYLQSSPISTPVLDLYSFFISLTSLLQDSNIKEKQLHEFILKHPVVLDPYSVRILSEVRLGGEYRIDLVMQYGLESKHTLLIELEKANLLIFTKSGRQRAEVTHAFQQVEDWLQWWKEHPNEVPHPLDSSITPEGLVVIGRSSALDEKDRRKLLHLNSNRNVKVITYDDLLDRIENLIYSLESTSD